MRVFMLRRNKWLLPATALLLAAAALLLTGPLLNRVSSGHRSLPIYEVATEDNVVGISFDASWGGEFTPLILDILDEYQARATFFLVNIWLDEYPALAKEIALRGHEIGLHSATHPHCTRLSEEEFTQELRENRALALSTTGYAAALFRPPFGDYNDRVVELTREAGLECIQWSVDSLDWKDLSAEAIFQRVTEDIHPGDIVLFHNNGLHTAEALPAILEYLAEQGLRATAISDMLLTGDCYVDINGVQRGK